MDLTDEISRSSSLNFEIDRNYHITLYCVDVVLVKYSLSFNRPVLRSWAKHVKIPKMIYRSVIRTLSRSASFILRNTSLGSGFSNSRNTVPLSTNIPALKDEKVKVSFVLADGKRLETEAKIGDTLLDVVVNNDLNIEGFGACEGTLTCSTCHVILKQKDFDRLPEEASDEERDMLDLAYGLTDTSRLGCQITLTKELDGLEVQVPETINDVRS